MLPDISFANPAAPKKGVAVVFADEKLKLGPVAGEYLAGADGLLEKAAKAASFKGKANAILDLIAPAGLSCDRLIVIGLGKPGELGESEWMKLGGVAMGAIKSTKATAATVLLELPDAGLAPEMATSFAAGAKLRAYTFDKYKSKKTNDDENGEPTSPVKLAIGVENARDARKLWTAGDGVTDGVILARDLVNEPANVLDTVEFAKRAKALEALGVEVEILEEKDMKKLKMNALLGVAQGSVKPPKLVIMKWNGGKKNDKPIAFIGKGVVFDTGGISIKPAGGMEDMKGDMGGAAAVTGLMHALAARKAKANVIGVIGLVENMPDANAQRPGDIVTAMSGATIEIINTDAEGRLVLADALWYTQDRFKPRFMINLATLTGAIIVALGNHHAGIFSNDDELAENLAKAGKATEENVWRLPLSKDYDKLIDTPNADMKNTGGRAAGSITAAQFLQRFVNDVPWVHIDVAGTAMGSPKTEISKGWASGFGVRLLDRLVAENYEGK
ncbi:leucyl aminopeptidase [Rhizobiales bacterium]|uniref:leucyl aminopeptidase n=1 Tax=Hongsoonwoonella zoysiae TaxID=2821844 RepID=UPI00156145B6|nr:leucyl aminopeptidase [Hongsoonwoonella zoysiae]NRG18937.1 leucyl aminopeptidase [Hongsoonwoonella zoysiae]